MDISEQIIIIYVKSEIGLNSNIYKVGKTKNLKNIYNCYNQLLFNIPCNNCNNAKMKVLRYLKDNEKFTFKPEYGYDYFQGDILEMLSDIMYLINEYHL